MSQKAHLDYKQLHISGSSKSELIESEVDNLAARIKSIDIMDGIKKHKIDEKRI